jgi:hypothetical protein
MELGIIGRAFLLGVATKLLTLHHGEHHQPVIEPQWGPNDLSCTMSPASTTEQLELPVRTQSNLIVLCYENLETCQDKMTCPQSLVNGRAGTTISILQSVRIHSLMNFKSLDNGPESRKDIQESLWMDHLYLVSMACRNPQEQLGTDRRTL